MRSLYPTAAVILATLVPSVASAAGPVSTGTAVPVGSVAALSGPVVAHARPAATSARIDRVAGRGRLTGGRTVLPVLSRDADSGGSGWLRVLLPGRPNGKTGWIRERGTIPARVAWQVRVRTSARRVTVHRDGVLVRSFAAVVGTPWTPTPHGRFYVEEVVVLGPGEAGAPYALALSARSEVWERFAGGPGQIAIHGMRNLVGVPGTAVSNGCVRLPASAIRWLARRAASGTVVIISR